MAGRASRRVKVACRACEQTTVMSYRQASKLEETDECLFCGHPLGPAPTMLTPTPPDRPVDFTEPDPAA